MILEKYYCRPPYYRIITGETSFLQVSVNPMFPGLEMRDYPLTGLHESFRIEDGWTPCTQDDFVAAYVTAINRISEVSGIEHLPLVMEPNFLTESNQES
jgi:hypothetical protein